MNEILVDARGEKCPRPVILSKRALDGAAPGDRIVVRLDDAVSAANVRRFLADHGAPAETLPPGPGDPPAEITLAAVVGAAPAAAPAPAEAYCPTCAPPGGPVFVLSRDGMGSGSDELARILVQAAVNALPEVSPAPAALVLYNAGVKLAVSGSPVLPALKRLEASGVRLLVCGTCANFFEIKETIAAGTLSNMYDILTALAAARSVVAL